MLNFNSVFNLSLSLLMWYIMILLQVRNELLAVGANDPYVRIYDRRKIKTQDVVTVSANNKII